MPTRIFEKAAGTKTIESFHMFGGLSRQRLLLRGSAHDEVPAHSKDAHDGNFDEPVVIMLTTGILGKAARPKTI